MDANSKKGIRGLVFLAVAVLFFVFIVYPSLQDTFQSYDEMQKAKQEVKEAEQRMADAIGAMEKDLEELNKMNN
jgi:hypothetical protein